jgi:hypothetical protein
MLVTSLAKAVVNNSCILSPIPQQRLARACKFGSFSNALIHVFLIGQVMEDVDGVKFLIFSKNPEGTRF